MLSERGAICIDNALFKGQVYLEPSERSESGEALRDFNQYVKDDPRTEQVMSFLSTTYCFTFKR